MLTLLPSIFHPLIQPTYPHHFKPPLTTHTNTINHTLPTTALEVRNIAGELVIHDLPADRAVVLIVGLLEGQRVELGVDLGLSTLLKCSVRYSVWWC